MSDEIKEAIEQSATDGIKQVTTDNQTVEAHPLPDQIAADKHVSGNDGASKPHRGLRITKLIPPGCQ